MRRTWLIFSQAVTVAVAMLFVVATLKPDWLRRGPPSTSGRPDIVSLIEAGPSTSAASAPQSYAIAASRATPAVVSIAATKAGGTPRADDPWSGLFGERGRTAPNVERGSAVIASPEGYLLTNHHVINGASTIDVMLTDGRRTQARLIGSDPDTDLAVLKIDLDRLPAITFGRSEDLQVGDVVLAIGNPFDIGQTVTSGIVSGLGRTNLGVNPFDNFIQTDAAINPGNSGGALVDAQGHLVGINTMIVASGDNRGNLGIGFAIPASTSRQILEGLIRDGEIVRGWIGVEPENLTPELADSLKLSVREGVLVTGVLQDGPAHIGGVRPGDVVRRVGDRDVANTFELLNTVAGLKPQTRATLGIQRGPEALELPITVARRPTGGRVRAQRDER